MELEDSSINLNPKYITTLYDVDLMKRTVQDMDVKVLLKKCPVVTLKKNALFYHATSDTENYKEKLNKKPTYEDKMTLYYFNFLNHYQKIIHDQEKNCEILWNTESLKLLDLTKTSVNLGFNPTQYRLDEPQTTSMTTINNYCKKNKLDGVITFNIDNIQKENTDSNFHYLVNDNIYPLFPVVYLTSIEEYGNHKLNHMGLINLQKGTKSFLSYQDASKLLNLFFCDIAKVIKFGHKIEVDILFEYSHYADRLILKGEEKHDIGFIFEIKSYLLDLLLVNNTNLNDQCLFSYPNHIEMNELTAGSSIDNVEITYDIILDEYNDEIFNLILHDIAIKNDIKPFIYMHYTDLDKIDYLKSYTYELINEHYDSIKDIKRLIDNIEKKIISKLNFYYKSSDKGFKSNVNFINLEYIPSTYDYIKNKIMNELENKENAIEVIKGNEFDKNIVKFFNVNKLYHSITNNKYDKTKLLYQDLLNDLAAYKNLPEIDLSYMALIADLSDTEDKKSYVDYLKYVKLNIYDVYKKYIAGEMMFYELYDFIGIDRFYEFIKNFGTINNIDINILLNYNKIIKQKGMEKYKIDVILKELKKTNLTDIEYFIGKINTLKMHIIVTDLYDLLMKYYNLPEDEEIVAFIKNQVEKIINADLDKSDSVIREVLSGNKMNTLYFISLFESINQNDTMLDMIYEVLDKPLSSKNKRKLLNIIGDKNLLKVYMSYLINDITKKELSNAVFLSLVDSDKKNDEDEEEKPKKSKKSKKNDEDTED